MFSVDPIIFDSHEDKENKIFKEIEAIFSEEQFGPTANYYKVK